MGFLSDSYARDGVGAAWSPWSAWPVAPLGRANGKGVPGRRASHTSPQGWWGLHLWPEGVSGVGCEGSECCSLCRAVCAHVCSSRPYGVGVLGGMCMSPVCFCGGCGCLCGAYVEWFYGGGGVSGVLLGHRGYACKCVSVGCVDHTCMGGCPKCVCIQNGAHTVCM